MEKQQRYWRKNLQLTGSLLAIWFIVTFVIGWFARDLQSFQVLGFPFTFYMAAQGALIIYVALVGYYAYRMNQLDHDFDMQERDEG
jgi:putative solute:sodium symporter small subunit